MLTAQERFRAVLAEYVAPLMKQHGFKRKRNRWGKRGPVGWLVYEIQVSSFSSRDSLRFTINLGLQSDRLSEKRGETGWRERMPPAHECHSSQRIGELMPLGNDWWWELDAAADDAMVGGFVRAVTEDLAIPYLEAFVGDDAMVELDRAVNESMDGQGEEGQGSSA